MIARVRDIPPRIFLGLLTLVTILALFALLLFAPPDGNERAQLLQFVGRFHPLSVHLPIALLVLVPFLEWAGRRRNFEYLTPAAGFLLVVAMCGAIVAAMLGWCLARSGGYSGPLVKQHMWSGVGVAAAAWLCWVLRARASHGESRRPYLMTLIATVGLVSFAGYRGGQLSQGENHLTELMPEPLARVFELTASNDEAAHSPNAGPTTFYGARVQPVFANHCVTCHGRSKHKSNLRLDSYEGVMRGGKHGAVIKPGDPKNSNLFHRVTLPMSDDDVMPPENRRLLSASEVKLLDLWISAGASGTQLADAITDAPSAPATPTVAEVTFEEADPAMVARQRADLAPAVSQVRQRLPNVVDYQSRDSADLVISASWMGANFGDAELAALAPLSGRIVAADFSSTAVTDRSAGLIASMKQLRTLRLMHTKITDATVQAMGSLDQLEILSVFDTPVTSAALPAIAHLPKLRHVYAGKTKISALASVPQEIKGKLVL